MGAYDYMDEAVAGLLDGLDNQIEGRRAVKDLAGIEFGYPVFGYVADTKGAYAFKKDVGKIVFDADFVTSNSILITVNGVSAGAVVFATDHDTTADLVVAAVAALAGVECVLDSADATNRTFLIRVKGATAVVTEAVTLGATQADGTITYDTGQVFLGICCKTQNAPGLYEQYDAVNIVVDGRVWAQSGSAASNLDPVYVADSGKVANAGEAIGANFKSNVAAAGLVLTRVTGQTNLGLSAKFA